MCGILSSLDCLGKIERKNEAKGGAWLVNMVLGRILGLYEECEGEAGWFLVANVGRNIKGEMT